MSLIFLCYYFVATRFLTKEFIFNSPKNSSSEALNCIQHVQGIFFNEFKRKMSRIKSNFGPKTIGVIYGDACLLKVKDITTL
jgi:hypothetical protein